MMSPWRSIILLGLLMLLSPGNRADENDPQVVAITSASFDPGIVSRNVLRAIYVMRLNKWNDGTPIKVFVLDDSTALHEAFSKEVLQFFPRQLRQAWDSQVFSGLGQYPERVDSEPEMLAKVKLTPGSIGYISKSEVDEDVRILQIEP